MAKTKTSQKRKNLSVEDMPIVKLKNPELARPYSPTAQLADKDFIARALADALLDGDAKALKDILRAHLHARDILGLAQRGELSKRTAYQALSPNGNPTLDTFAKLAAAATHRKRPKEAAA